MDARKVRIEAADAWTLLSKATQITVAKGKQVEEIDPAKHGKEAVLKLAMGPSGNLRAPTLRSGDRFVIGFNADLYTKLWGKG